MPRRLLMVWGLGLLSFVAAGCSSKSEETNTREVPEFTEEYRVNSCLHTADEGGEVDERVRVNDRRTIAFGKVLDIGRVRRLGPASVTHTLRAIDDDGIQVLRVARSMPGSCSAFMAVTAAPSPILTIWDGFGRSGLVGLFLPVNRTAGTGILRPLVLVRQDTTRYTLIHEYTHALFNREREDHGDTDAQMMSDIETAERAYKTLDESRLQQIEQQDRTFLADAAEKWIRLSSIYTKAFEHFALEEITVESYLAQLANDRVIWDRGEFDRKASGEYMQSNYEQVVQRYVLLTKDLDPAVRALRREGMQDTIGRINAVIAKMNQQLNEARNLIDRYASTRAVRPRIPVKQVDSPRTGLLATGLVPLSHSASPLHSCGRAELFSQFMKRMNSELSH